MSIELVYAKEEDVPEAHKELYTQKGDKWELTGIVGLKTQADVERIQTALTKERDDHKRTKERLRPITIEGVSIVDMGEDQVKAAVEMLDGYDELKTKAESAGKLNEDEIAKIVESRLKTKMAPIEREKQLLADQLKTTSEQVVTFQQREERRTIHDQVRAAMIASKARPDAEEDVLLNAERMFEISQEGKVITKDGVGVTPGITPDIWFQEMQPKRAYWWPESQGGGAKGGKGGAEFANNPWKAETFNLTQQGQITVQNPQLAERLKAAAGAK